MTREEAKQILDRALSFVSADEATALLSESSEAATRFANSEITQNVARSDMKCEIRVAFGNRVGSASINSFDDESLQSAVQRAEAMAKVAAPDTEFVPCPGPADAPEVRAFDPSVASVDPMQRADAVKTAVAEGDRAGVKLAGSFTARTTTEALANTKGAFFFHPETFARFVCTAMTDSSSGWAEGVSHRLGDIDPAALAARAANKANAGRDPVEVEPGDWTVVLEPPAVADMLVFIAYSMDAKAAIEGRSVFAGKEGTDVAGPHALLCSDPAHPTCPATPFHTDGMPAHRVEWVQQGRLNTLSYDRYWAEKQGKPYTGAPSNFVMAGGQATEEEMISRVKRGLLVTRFWYIRHVDPMQLILTGMTRDGLFLIENGEVTRGVKNLRFNESPLIMLKNVEALGKPKRCGSWAPIEAPGILAHAYTFTSGTSF